MTVFHYPNTSFFLSLKTVLNRTLVVGLAVSAMAYPTPALAQTSSHTLPDPSNQTPSPPNSSITPEESSLPEKLNWSTNAADLELTSPNLASESAPTNPSLEEDTNSLPAPSTQSQEEETAPTTDPNYSIPPRVAPNERINPSTTTLPLNDTPITHLTEWEFTGGKTFTDTTESDLTFNGILKLDSQVVESLTRNNIYTVDQKGSYVQLRTVPRQRTVTTRTTEPQTMTGLELQMSLTGACILPNSSGGEQCTYTPGLVIDRDSIDPQFFVPTRVFQTSQVGDVVTPESLAVIQLPGFQRGANGQEIGLDLYFPNLGTFPRDSDVEKKEIDRDKEIDYTITGTFSQVRQVVKANDTEAVLGRTIRGITIFADDENRLSNTALQLGAQLLPDVIPNLEGSTNPANTNINRNLFLAANNTRLPASSFTIYSAGIGRADSLTPDMTDLSQISTANYNSLWLGLSPVIERSFEAGQLFYEARSTPRVIANAGAEGGADTDIELFSAVNNDLFSTANLQDFYAQIYLDFFAQDVNYVSENIYREETRYYPHLSFTGNFTSSQDVIRYYAGVIASEEVKAYLGADYTRNTSNGWNFRAGGVGYLNPDRDYYSQLWGSVSKRISLGQDANLILATGFNYALDRETKIGDIVSISPASQLTASARLNWGIVSLGLTNYFGDILPNSYENQLLADLTIRPSDNLRLSAYFAPLDENSSRSRYGASLLWKLRDGYNSPTLSLNWQNQDYDYGTDAFGNNLLVNDNSFTVLFRVGAPANPFAPPSADASSR
ncbi:MULTISPECIES: hypothetical protein [unclassified Coleofasciculus]|uniref:hypothetical protein n=1 Tax=unclassified Coleofasciculus TaxID=2692782 RepID=UPI00187FFA46|nr:MULTISPECIES: hypothetical protein [unclassified Coleofasciculus]MBE9127753.1 hypothetical protein [Coleofasciculus sp. LEGE 07081]MBE9149453.1 hypothetical protein [Coleofasciculus sp. LEGE 07092]